MPQYEIQGGANWPETLRQYLTAACWTDEPDGGGGVTWQSLDRFTAASRKAAQADLNEFLEKVERHKATGELGSDWPTNLWLTRNRTGAGFGDDDPCGPDERVLQAIALGMGERRIEAWKGRLNYVR